MESEDPLVKSHGYYLLALISNNSISLLRRSVSYLFIVFYLKLFLFIFLINIKDCNQSRKLQSKIKIRVGIDVRTKIFHSL